MRPRTLLALAVLMQPSSKCPTDIPSNGGGGGGGVGSSPTGSLTLVVITPASVQGSIFITGPDNLAYSATGSTQFTSLKPGTYYVAAESVTVAGTSYQPSPANQAIVVPSGWASAWASVYYCPRQCPWVQKAPMISPRESPGVGVVGGALYAIGGASAPNAASVEAYDPLTDSWATKAPMNTARSGIAVGVSNGILYALGGTSGAGVYLRDVEAYDPGRDIWTPLSPMPTARTSATAGVVGGIIYVVGGFGVGGAVASVEAYDPSTDQWTTKAPFPFGSGWMSAAVVGGTLNVVGSFFPLGSGRGAHLVAAYDPATDSWTQRASETALVSGTMTTVGVVKGSLYEIGGDLQETGVEAFDLTTNVWRPIQPAPEGLPGRAAAVIGGTLYEVGGIGAWSQPTNVVEAYTP